MNKTKVYSKKSYLISKLRFVVKNMSCDFSVTIDDNAQRDYVTPNPEDENKEFNANRIPDIIEGAARQISLCRALIRFNQLLSEQRIIVINLEQIDSTVQSKESMLVEKRRSSNRGRREMPAFESNVFQEDQRCSGTDPRLWPHL